MHQAKIIKNHLTSPKPDRLLDLENPRDRGKLSDPNRYLDANEGRLVVLDEVHRVPELFQVPREGTLMSFYRTAAGAELDLVLEFPGLSERWAIEIKSSSMPRLTRGFYHAVEDVAPDRTFVVYAGDEGYPLSEGVDAVGLGEIMGLIEGAGQGRTAVQ